MPTSEDQFIFARHDDVGSAAAEEDTEFLKNCFVDTGDLQVLLNADNPKRVIVGRTGAGKSALLNEISNRCENVIEISPSSLSLNYIANNNVISFFEEVGVNLSVFYGLLWRHILVVELLKAKFNITNENAQKDYTRNIRKILYKRNRFKEMAVEYLEQWGNKFWLTTEERIRELTSKIEQNLESSLKGGIPGTVDLTAKGARRLTEEQKTEVIQIGQKVVSDIQIRELENIISVLGEEIFTDPQQKYFLIVDGLDEEWVDERIKYKLVKSLIDTIRRFKNVRTVKILIAMRHDLLDKTIHSTMEQGFQQEKYESLYLRLNWDKKTLREIIDKRIAYLVSRRYTTKEVGLEDIFPENVDKVPTIEYLVAHTFNRPRDIIAFLNECISNAVGSPRITAHLIKQSEEQYSYKRLQSLAFEWQIVYPGLLRVSQMLFGMRDHFELSKADESWFEEKCADFFGESEKREQHDPFTLLLDGLYQGSSNFNSVRNTFFRNLYQTGLIGIKPGPTASVQWCYIGSPSLAPGQVRANSSIYIHPMFHRALGVTRAAT